MGGRRKLAETETDARKPERPRLEHACGRLQKNLPGRQALGEDKRRLPFLFRKEAEGYAFFLRRSRSVHGIYAAEEPAAALQDAQQFLDLSADGDDMDFLQAFSETLPEHGDVRHGRKLHHERRSLPQQQRGEDSDVGRTVPEPEELASRAAAPRRVGIDEVAFRQFAGRADFLTVEFNIGYSERGAVAPRGVSKCGVPFEIQHPVRHRSKGAAVGTQAAGDVADKTKTSSAPVQGQSRLVRRRSR